MDDKGEDYLSSALKKSAVTYASIRGLNAVVSILKDSSLYFSPAGIGVSIAVGEILDPIDDLTERASVVMLVSFVSLSSQKIIMELGSSAFLIFCSILLIVLIFPIWIRNKITVLVYHFGVKLLLTLLILRFLLPFAAITNEIVANSSYFQTQTQQSMEVIKQVSKEKDLVPENRGIFENNRISKVKEKIEELKNKSSEIINSLLTVIVIFLFQTVFIPLLTLYIIIKFIPYIFSKIKIKEIPV